MTKSPLFNPKLRFNEFNNAWLSLKVSDILQYEQPTKYIVDSSDYDNLFKIPVLTANKGFILGYTNEINNIYNKGPSIIFDDFTTDFKYVDFPYKIKSSAIKILTSKNDYSLYFIFNLWQKNKFIPIGHNRHYISIIQEIFFYIPSLDEQTKIANFFALLDKQIQLIERKLELYELRKKYYLNNMFCNKDEITPKIRFEGFEDNSKTFILNDIIIKNYIFDSETNIFYDAPSIMNSRAKYFSNEKYKLAPQKSIIFIKDGSNCGSFIYAEESSKIASTCEFIRTNQNNKYIYWLLNKNEKIIKNKLIIGETIPHLYKSELIKYKICIFTDPNEQTKIANLFSLLDESIQNLKNQKDQLTKRKTYYLNNMFI